MSLDSVIQEVQRSLPECLAVGVVDMTTGLLLGVTTVDETPEEVLHLVTAATGELDTQRRRDETFQEVVVLSEELIQVVQRLRQNRDVVLTCVLRASANLGTALAAARLGLPMVDAAI